MLKFYYAPQSSATRVHWALEELGVPYEKVRVHLDKGEQKDAAFLAVNPNGKVPALVDGDAKIFESLAMFLWLGEKYGEAKGMWPKAGTPERAEAYSWSVWSTAEVVPCVIDRIVHTADVHWAYPKDQKSAAVAAKALEGWTARVAILEKHLSGRDFMLGKTFTLVDCAVGMAIGLGAMMGGLPIGDFPRVGAWLQRCQTRAAFGKVIAEK
jgi:glutathione S-transferase